MGISWRNGARPQRLLEILWTNSNVLRILGGPGRNRPGLKMSNPTKAYRASSWISQNLSFDKKTGL